MNCSRCHHIIDGDEDSYKVNLVVFGTSKKPIHHFNSGGICCNSCTENIESFYRGEEVKSLRVDYDLNTRKTKITR